MTPMERIIAAMDPVYSLTMRRAMARGILSDYNREIADAIRDPEAIGVYTDQDLSNREAAADVAETYTPKEA